MNAEIFEARFSITPDMNGALKRHEAAIHTPSSLFRHMEELLGIICSRNGVSHRDISACTAAFSAAMSIKSPLEAPFPKDVLL
jgi:hypothetical protein